MNRKVHKGISMCASEGTYFLSPEWRISYPFSWRTRLLWYVKCRCTLVLAHVDYACAISLRVPIELSALRGGCKSCSFFSGLVSPLSLRKTGSRLGGGPLCLTLRGFAAARCSPRGRPPRPHYSRAILGFAVRPAARTPRAPTPHSDGGPPQRRGGRAGASLA